MSNSNAYHSGPSDPTPEQRLLLMNDEEWEKFIEECARQLMSEGLYQHVQRLGGAGDKGRDVCGYTQQLPVIDTWDLYQAKHYFGTLSPSEFAPELAKFISSVYSAAYSRPRTYYICALKTGVSLLDLVLNPEQMRAWILEEWKKKNGKFGAYTQPLTKELETFISTFPFEIIKIMTPADLLEIHKRSSEYWARFGILGKRGANPPVPDVIGKEENVYVTALLRVYSEEANSHVANPSNIPSHLKKHFSYQRKLFYSAEGLNRFSRDKLPGAFDNLLDQIELGVGSVVSAPYPDGMSRLKETLNTANSLPVTSNPLSSRLEAGDLQGGCHHLANQARITWVDEDDD